MRMEVRHSALFFMQSYSPFMNIKPKLLMYHSNFKRNTKKPNYNNFKKYI